MCELSFGNGCTLLNAAQPEAVAIPVFTARVFRHSAIYVRGDSALRSIADLGGHWNAFTAAKQRSLHRLVSLKASYLPVGWGGLRP